MNPQATRENCAILCGGMGEYFYVPTRTLGDKLPSQKPSLNDVLNHLYTTTYGPKILKSLNTMYRGIIVSWTFQYSWGRRSF